ncbi:hypothetical protein KIN20_001864 [Parelaphostrongylus tenuis]|uniref:Glycoside hydrolase family 19 catalytic domain-containing protein n=1 Tax=Parelaphostrongylus tenuis TaxID=148309 RepID=A0AAD5MFY9_PARTN|nr:hypothetical protein KIN20_001864 [Parelaphostrongylus tenuis]
MLRSLVVGHRRSCAMPSDPNNLPPSSLEEWFTKDVFEDLFPFANLGWGPHPCSPYSYEAFVIAARYFPKFGTSSPNTIFNVTENTRRDLAAFFAHALQETGENNASTHISKLCYDNLTFACDKICVSLNAEVNRGNRSTKEANDCFYRGGLYNWFEGGPISPFLDPNSPGFNPIDGDKCIEHGRYCIESPEIDFFYPCSKNRTDNYFTGCYFGRGAVQISYNYNYGQFINFLESRNIHADLLNEPNLVMTQADPPLAFLASLWFYMTPQPPKPAMHDIVMGTWNSGEENAAAGYTGPIFGPTSLIINNECGGEDKQDPGGPGESRRIKAFKWFCSYFGVPAGDDRLLSCKDMPVKFGAIRYNYSYHSEWTTLSKEQPCDCAPSPYGDSSLPSVTKSITYFIILVLWNV